jgi:xylulokinase
MFVGIDLGTSGVKTLLMNDRGEVLRTVTKAYDVLMPQPGWTEQDPQVWFDQTITALTELIAGYEPHIQAMSFSGQMHGMVTLNAQGDVIRPAILWNDQRTITQVADLYTRFGVADHQTLTGNIPLTGLTAPKVLWMQQQEPALFAQVATIMLPKDYLVHRFTGHIVTDLSDVSGTHYFHPGERQYAPAMLAALSITESMLPTVMESHGVVGPLIPDIQALLGLSHPVQVIVGGGDQAVGAIGVGAVTPQVASLSLGTSGVLFVPTASFVVDTVNHLQSYCDASGQYHVMGVLLNAAGVIQWWLEEVLGRTDYDAFYEALDPLQLDTALHFVPHLSGERFPINDPLAKGVFYGLGYYHNQSMLNRAVVEGVTMSLKEAFEKIKAFEPHIRALRITGGGARSEVWTQMISDALGVEVLKVNTEEGPSYGAAMLAYAGHTNTPIRQVTDRFVRLGNTYTPRSDMRAYYDQRFEQFMKLYPVLKSLHVEVKSARV